MTFLAGILALALAASDAPPPARGPASKAEGEAFQVSLVPPASVRPGAAADARVVVTARGPYHVNRDYPTSFRVDRASTATFPAEKVPLGEGAERTPCKDFPGETCTLSAPLGFRAPASGETRIAGVVAFSVCNPDRCLIEKVPVAVVVPMATSTPTATSTQ
jgi:hypothetical protein